MDPSDSPTEAEHLLAGNVSTVVRIGDTARRTTGPWTPAVHALLRYLEVMGFEGAPRVLGIDEQGREMLTAEGLTKDCLSSRCCSTDDIVRHAL
jgi:hypothetical protein